MAAPAVRRNSALFQGAVMVDDVRSAMVFAETMFRGSPTGVHVESIRMDLGAAHDRVRRIVVRASARRRSRIARCADLSGRSPGEGLVRQRILREDSSSKALAITKFGSFISLSSLFAREGEPACS